MPRCLQLGTYYRYVVQSKKACGGRAPRLSLLVNILADSPGFILKIGMGQSPPIATHSATYFCCDPSSSKPRLCSRIYDSQLEKLVLAIYTFPKFLFYSSFRQLSLD